MCASLICHNNSIFQCQWSRVLGIGIELYVTSRTHFLRDTHRRSKRTRHKAEVIVVHKLTYGVCSLASVVGMVDKERMPFAQEILVALAVLEVRVARHLVVLAYIVVLNVLLQFGNVSSVLCNSILSLLHVRHKLIHLLALTHLYALALTVAVGHSQRAVVGKSRVNVAGSSYRSRHLFCASVSLLGSSICRISSRVSVHHSLLAGISTLLLRRYSQLLVSYTSRLRFRSQLLVVASCVLSLRAVRLVARTLSFSLCTLMLSLHALLLISCCRIVNNHSLIHLRLSLTQRVGKL